jgi:hypothetical protein
MVAHFWTMSDRSATTSTISNSIGPGGAAYELRKDTEIYAEYSGKFVNEKVTTESYHRTRVGAGIRSNFDDLPTVSRNWQSLNLAIFWHPLLGTRQARAISLSS